MFSGHGSEVLRFVGPRQQGIDVAVGMTVDDPGKDVGQIAERIDVMEFVRRYALQWSPRPNRRDFWVVSQSEFSDCFIRRAIQAASW